jgi:hypothetical protein
VLQNLTAPPCLAALADSPTSAPKDTDAAEEAAPLPGTPAAPASSATLEAQLSLAAAPGLVLAFNPLYAGDVGASPMALGPSPLALPLEAGRNSMGDATCILAA